MVYPPLHLLEKLQEPPVQVLHRVRAPVRELHGLYPLPSPLELYRVGKRGVEARPLKVRRRKRLLRELGAGEHEWRPCKG